MVAFALIGEVVSPKAFSGLFASAPSVALASLSVTVVAEGTSKAHQDAVGMVVGGVAMVVCCIVAVVVIPKAGALWGSFAAWVSWAAVACGLCWAVFIGAR